MSDSAQASHNADSPHANGPVRYDYDLQKQVNP